MVLSLKKNPLAKPVWPSELWIPPCFLLLWDDLHREQFAHLNNEWRLLDPDNSSNPSWGQGLTFTYFFCFINITGTSLSQEPSDLRLVSWSGSSETRKKLGLGLEAALKLPQEVSHQVTPPRGIKVPISSTAGLSCQLINKSMISIKRMGGSTVRPRKAETPACVKAQSWWVKGCTGLKVISQGHTLPSSILVHYWSNSPMLKGNIMFLMKKTSHNSLRAFLFILVIF